MCVKFNKAANISEALDAIGFTHTDGCWKSAAGTSNVGELRVQEDVNIFGEPAVGLLKEIGKRQTYRFLTEVDVTQEFRFPTDYIEYRRLNCLNFVDQVQLMFVGRKATASRWMCFDEREEEVVGFACGTFEEMVRLFDLGTQAELAASFKEWLQGQGEERLRDLHSQAIDQQKNKVLYRRKRFEQSLLDDAELVELSNNWLHDALEGVAQSKHQLGVDEPSVVYSLMYMADSHSPHVAQTAPTGTEWFEFVSMHQAQKRTNELAWVYRTVNGVQAPYAIWNPSINLWELL